MSLRRRLLFAALCCGCGSTQETPPSFAADQPVFFEQLNLLDEAKRAAFPAFERRWEQIAKDTLVHIDAGDVVEDRDREQAARALVYAANAVLAGEYAIEDGYLSSADLLRPPRYSKGDDQDEREARVKAAQKWFTQAAELSVPDERLPLWQQVCAVGLQTIEGAFTADVLLNVNSAAKQSWLGAVTAMQLVRSPTLHPGYAPHIEQLISIICDASRLSCGQGPLPPAQQLSLSRHVAAPLYLSDLLAKRGEAQVRRADLNPAQADPLLKEAVERFALSEKYLAAARHAADDPALSHFPGRSRLGERTSRLAQLLLATQARQKNGSGPELPGPAFYEQPEYLDSYQCVACHAQ